MLVVSDISMQNSSQQDHQSKCQNITLEVYHMWCQGTKGSIKLKLFFLSILCHQENESDCDHL